jgi:hypothetical protein
MIAQSLYGMGAMLCLWDTRLSIAAIVAVQLFYVVAPGFRQNR